MWKSLTGEFLSQRCPLNEDEPDEKNLVNERSGEDEQFLGRWTANFIAGKAWEVCGLVFKNGKKTEA